MLPKDLIYTTNGLGNIFDHLSDYQTIMVNGNGVNIVGPYKNDADNKWTGIHLNNEKINLVLSNLTIKGFNHGLFIDKGACTLINVKITDNYCDYSTEHDWGAGIINLGGVCSIVNCSFINNHAKYGGAIFNAGYLIIDNMTQFIGNTAYGAGNEITYVDAGIINYNNTEYKGEIFDLFTNGTKFGIDYRSGLSTTEIDYIIYGAIIGSFLVGFISGITGGIVVGVVIGAITGLLTGGILSAVVVTNNYNYYVDNVKTALILTGGSLAAGIVGGLLGGLVNKLIKASTANGEGKPLERPTVTDSEGRPTQPVRETQQSMKTFTTEDRNFLQNRDTHFTRATFAQNSNGDWRFTTRQVPLPPVPA